MDAGRADPVRPGIGLTGLVQNGAAGQKLDGAARAVLATMVPALAAGKFALLTGAGLSTDSGIPDYRGPDAAPRQPLTYQEFVGSEPLRRRYWARNHIGWATMRHASPNAGHRAVAAMESAGHLTGVVTQNVDRLHEDAGARNVVDLHGRFDEVVCLRCGEVYARAFIAVVLAQLNPGFLEEVAAAGGAGAAPDADADLDHERLIDGFRVACCPLCGGMLKPDFVFFGENVPKERVERAYAMVDSAASLLVAGSSLTVMSGLRFVRKAARDGKPVMIINRGATRGDGLAGVKLEAGVSESLEYLLDLLAPGLARPAGHRVQ
ncbi:NAD-dependent protein deacetylase [Arthrobacter dokdonensis]|uniref:NAD-dependent protein deacetylase n=1 Tax=Arthrobacter dokdonellae TaxID=2211210 RepID=UPI001D132067|nr:NAD-dependent protein deacetylase [Arthrobacter dokdonellae]